MLDGVSVVPTEALGNRQIDHSVLPKISFNKAAELRRHLLEPGDILFARRGVQATGHIGYVRAFENGFVCGTGAIRLRIRQTSGISPEYVSHFLANPVSVAWFKYHAIGATMPNLNEGIIRSFAINLPPIGEQRAIARMLGALDDKIELNRRMNETLEAMARTLSKSWFVNFDPVRAKAEGRDPGLPKPIADLFPARFIGSELGEIPEGWTVGSLGAVGQPTIGGDWGEDEPFARAVDGSCPRGVDLEHLRSEGHCSAPRRCFTATSLQRRAMDERDVLIAGSGAGPTGRPLWMCASLLIALGTCVYSNFCKRIRCESAAKAVCLDSWLHGMRGSREIWDYVNGTSVPNLDVHSLLAGKEIPIPPATVLDQYHDFVRPIWQKKYSGQNHTLAAARDTLLPKLISGELRVKHAERVVGEAS